MIRKATSTDIDAILELTKACANHMISKDIFQWNDHYPNRTAFENDVERGELFVMEKDSETIGCIVISTFMDLEYRPITWMTETKHNIYIHRLAIHPRHQNKGFAQLLMDFAETYARTQNFVSVRLDTFSQNTRNQRFYELRGYKRLESIQFPKQSEHPFYCYEYLL